MKKIICLLLTCLPIALFAKAAPFSLSEDVPQYVKQYYEKSNLLALDSNPDDLKVTKPQAACFSGGGAKGVAYLGTLEYLHNAGLLKNIKNFSGASAGAISAGLVSICYKNGKLNETLYKKLIDKMYAMDYGSFITRDQTYDIDLYQILNNMSTNPGEMLAAWGLEIFKQEEKTRGIVTGDKVLDVFNQTFEDFTGNSQLTFQEHYNKTGVHLVLMSCSLCYCSSIVFDYKSVPDMPVTTAMRASMAIPYCFTPVNYKNDYFVDGGTKNNYPVWYFDDQDSVQTIGFVLSPEKSLTIQYKNLDGKSKDLAYLGQLAGLLMNNEENCYLRNSRRTICINTGEVSTMSFGMTQAQKDTAITNAFNAAQDYFGIKAELTPYPSKEDENSDSSEPSPDEYEL